MCNAARVLTRCALAIALLLPAGCGPCEIAIFDQVFVIDGRTEGGVLPEAGADAGSMSVDCSPYLDACVGQGDCRPACECALTRANRDFRMVIESCAFEPNFPMERNADRNASCTASRASSSERMKRRATRSIMGMCVRTSVSYAPASPSRRSATSDASCRCWTASTRTIIAQ